MTAALGRPDDLRPAEPLQAAGIGLWVFIGVGCALFTLFVAAYIMRMESRDWSAIALPRQLWLSTACLIAGSLVMQAAAGAADAAATRAGTAAHAARRRAGREGETRGRAARAGRRPPPDRRGS